MADRKITRPSGLTITEMSGTQLSWEYVSDYIEPMYGTIEYNRIQKWTGWSITLSPEAFGPPEAKDFSMRPLDTLITEIENKIREIEEGAKPVDAIDERRKAELDRLFG